MLNLLKKLLKADKTINARSKFSAAGISQPSTLESREYLAITSIALTGTTLKIQTDNTNNKILITGNGSTINVIDQIKNTTQVYKNVSNLEFRGGSGNDRFENQATNINCLVYGNAGNDIIISGAGNDTVYGGDGNDLILGGLGNDILYGDNGNDQINGQAGNDKTYGGEGNDTLIAIDNSQSDIIQSDGGNDVIWVDKSGTATDQMVSNSASDFVQSVANFSNTADKTLDGDSISDPTLNSGAGYKNFSGYSLFSSSGPSINDIRQGSLGDCYFLGGLGAIALSNANALIKNMVDFNDGTFGIRLGNNFYRVDADLPVYSGSSTLAYAKLGSGNSLWVALAEKAFTYYRQGKGTYASIEGGWGIEVNRAFRAATTGDKAFTSFASADDLGLTIYNAWAGKQAVTVGIIANTSASVVGNLINSHLYTVYSVTKDSNGKVSSIVLRNPWGIDGAGSDSNKNDGLVTVTPKQLFDLKGYSRVQWGAVS